MELFAIAGQAIIGIVFILGALTDVLDRKTLLLMLQRKNLRHEEYLLYGAIALKIICGIALIVNLGAHLAAFFLAGFTLTANIIFHPFWACPPSDRKREYFAFVVHMAVIGGLLVIVGR